MTPDGIDFAAEGLLDGLDGAAREERLQLLERLHGDGFGIDELREAARDGRLIFLPAQRLVGGPARYCAREVAERGGISVELFLALRRALGLPEADPDAVAFNDGDLLTGPIVRAFLDAGVAEEQVLTMSRTLGRGMAQVSEVMRETALELSFRPEQTDLEFADEHTSTVERLLPLVGPMLEGVARLHLRHVVDSEVIELAERRSAPLPGGRPITVAFADLVGFTRLGEEVPPDELDRIARRLERLTADVLPAPVRLVKTIGDAVMLVCPEPEPLLEAAFALVEAADGEGEDFPQLHVGLAAGEAVSRAGDWYGRPVNLASRVTAIARPGSVLAADAVREAARDAAQWSFAGERRLKGVPAPVRLFRARRPGEREAGAPRRR